MTARGYLARRAAEHEAEQVARLLAAAGRCLAAQGFDNWDPPYPLDRVQADVAAGRVWIVRDADGAVDTIRATYTLAAESPRPYDPAPWPDPSRSARYLNRLAVDPARQGSGVGAWCLARIAEETRAQGADAVRCDVLARNERVRRFYERHGYVACGTRSHGGRTFASYECVVTPERARS